MGLQLIFVVETSKSCKSDWIYIKETIERFYTYNHAHVKLSVVYMGGKAKYTYKEKEVNRLISLYSGAAKNNESKVIYCFDCDDYDIKSEDADFLKTVKKYCREHGYEYVWFCKDIERVYLGRKVFDKQKRKEAETFKAKNLINGINEVVLSAKMYKSNVSNLLRILDRFNSYLNRK